MKSSPRLWLLLASLTLSAVLLFKLFSGSHAKTALASPTAAAPATRIIATEKKPAAAKSSDGNLERPPVQARDARLLLANLAALLQRSDARPQEALLTFKDDEA